MFTIGEGESKINLPQIFKIENGAVVGTKGIVTVKIPIFDKKNISTGTISLTLHLCAISVQPDLGQEKDNEDLYEGSQIREEDIEMISAQKSLSNVSMSKDNQGKKITDGKIIEKVSEKSRDLEDENASKDEDENDDEDENSQKYHIGDVVEGQYKGGGIWYF